MLLYLDAVMNYGAGGATFFLFASSPILALSWSTSLKRCWDAYGQRRCAAFCPRWHAHKPAGTDALVRSNSGAIEMQVLPPAADLLAQLHLAEVLARLGGLRLHLGGAPLQPLQKALVAVERAPGRVVPAILAAGHARGALHRRARAALQQPLPLLVALLLAPLLLRAAAATAAAAAARGDDLTQ